jgi:hypothetical protein
VFADSDRLLDLDRYFGESATLISASCAEIETSILRKDLIFFPFSTVSRSHLSRGVVEDNAERVAVAGAHEAGAVAHV